MSKKPEPGVSREERVSDEGLLRLENQLKAGNISDMVLKQWLKRYAESARSLIKKYDRYSAELED